MTTAIHRNVDRARAGQWPQVIARLPSGWAVMGDSQLLPGYCLLLPDPVVPSLNDLDEPSRTRYLLDMARLGDAITKAAPAPPRRINYEILGNLEPALHAHIIPRYHDEPPDLRTKAIWLYPPDVWNAPEHRFDEAKHASLRDAIAHALSS
jgi:diadenosine tetraphosphate (Ap4A) HIT family hydrolase